MSYILDALKKSEQQRPPGTVPDLFTVQGPQPPEPAQLRRGFVPAALLLAAAIGILAWFGAGRRADEVNRAGVEAVPQQPRELPTTERLAAPAAKTPAAPLAEAKARGEIGPRTPGSPSRTKPTRKTIVPPRLPAAITTAPAVAPGSHPLSVPQAPSAPQAEPTTDPGVEDPRASQATAALPVGETPSAPLTEPEEMPPADGRVLDLADLPASIREQLPALQISGHVWSEEPSLRLLTVDDQLLREGGETAPGVRLLEITAEGSVFAYRGWHFRVSGIRP